MICPFLAVGGALVLCAFACWAGFLWGRKDERLWWTVAADSDYHMRHVDGRDYTVLHASEFVDKYHNPLARYRNTKRDPAFPGSRA